MIVVVGGIKGGVGKSTLATNLAVVRASEGLKTLLIDADDQRSAMDWALQRNDYFKNKHCDHDVTTVALTGRYLHSEVQKLRYDYNDVIIDAGGRDTTSQRSALSVADYFVVPFKPRSLDIWTLNYVKTLYDEAKEINDKLKICVVLNQADARGSDNKDTHEIISNMTSFRGPMILVRNRKAFANAASHGLSVIEMDEDIKAKDELMKLYYHIYSIGE